QTSAMPIRLDAFEKYVRGVVATSTPERIRNLRDAVRIALTYTEALLLLGKTYYAGREYDQAIPWLERVSRSQPAGREASFFLALSAYHEGDLGKSESALNFLVLQMPLLEVYNNLGVVASRRGDQGPWNICKKQRTAIHWTPIIVLTWPSLVIVLETSRPRRVTCAKPWH